MFYLSKLDKPGIMTVLPHLNIFKYLEAQDDHHHLDGGGFAELKKETCAKHGFSCVLVCVPLLSIVHPWCQVQIKEYEIAKPTIDSLASKIKTKK